MNELVLDTSIDQLLEIFPIGSIEKAIGNNLYGINFKQTKSMVPMARDSFGYTFFTRPQLNLTRLNITNYRNFYNLLTSNPTSYQTYVRLMLDPRLAETSGIVCPFVDNNNPFISILSNNLKSISGWPDLTVPTYTSDTGTYGQEITFVDGATNNFEVFDIDAVFSNTKGNPLLYMFYIWIKYESLVFEGILNPYIDMITENEIDYNTRIYRIILDTNKKYVTNIGATGASFPINVPIGNVFDFNDEKPINFSSDINIRFRCNGFTAFEDILKLEFNKTVCIFNKDMKSLYDSDMKNGSSSIARDDDKVYRAPGGNYVKIPRGLMDALDSVNGGMFNLNYRAYPYINLVSNELEWWVDERRYNQDTSTNTSLSNTNAPISTKIPSGVLI